MANPPPVRPWLRLGSIRSGPAPAPAPAPVPVVPVPVPVPAPAPVLSLPQFRTASAPPSPHIQPVTQPQEPSPVVPAPPPPSSSLPTSPIQKATVTNISSVPSSPSRKPTPTQSPRTLKAPVQSPRHSPKTETTSPAAPAPPPSPFTLPPSQMKSEPKIPVEPESKTVLVQKTVEKPKQWLNGNGGERNGEARNHGHSHHGKHVLGKESEAREKGNHRKQLSDPSEESGMRVITIAGENRGAYMELIQSKNKHEPNYLHNNKGHLKTNGEGSVESESSSSEQGKSSSRKDKNQKGRTASSFPMAAYMNSNVQCVNNSLLFHTCCSHHDPGVRLSLSKKPFGEGYHLKEHVDGQNSS